MRTRYGGASPFSSALPDGEGRATVCVSNHNEEHPPTPADHDQERGAAYVCEKRETKAGKLSELEGVVKCINKRWKLLEALRPKESRLAPRRNSATPEWAVGRCARREQQAGWEGEWALQPMHCVRHAGRDGRVAAKVNRANGPTPPRMNRWPVGPELCFDLRTAKGITGGFSRPSPCPLPDGERVQRTVIPFAVLRTPRSRRKKRDLVTGQKLMYIVYL